MRDESTTKPCPVSSSRSLPKLTVTKVVSRHYRPFGTYWYAEAVLPGTEHVTRFPIGKDFAEALQAQGVTHVEE